MCCCGWLCSCFTLSSAELLPVECSVADWEWLPILARLLLAQVHYTHFLSLQLVERRLANFDTAVRKGQGISVYCVKLVSWNIAWLLIYWKVADIPPPPPPSHVTGGRPFWLVFWRLPTWEAPLLTATRGGGGGRLGLPSRGISPNTRKYGFSRRSTWLLAYAFNVIFSSWHGASFGVNAAIRWWLLSAV